LALLLVIAAALMLYQGVRRPGLARAFAAPALLLCVVAGLTLPDIDQTLPFGHRSALTHSIAPALLALWRAWLRPAAAGLALGLGLHLAADVFPEAMIGYATVKVPLAGSIGTGPSYVWLGANAVACSWLGGRLLRGEMPGLGLRLAALGATPAIGIWYLFQVDGGWWALAVYLSAAWFAWRRLQAPRKSATGAS
jgi:hypothetical protein